MIAIHHQVAGARVTSGSAPAHKAADLLGLAAAPTFALMAVLTAMPGAGPPDMLCAATHDVWPLSGMGLMYGLMSAFHLAPWLRLISRRWQR
jgi:hypothetical protein